LLTDNTVNSPFGLSPGDPRLNNPENFQAMMHLQAQAQEGSLERASREKIAGDHDKTLLEQAGITKDPVERMSRKGCRLPGTQATRT
jgi:hypothetical protein